MSGDRHKEVARHLSEDDLNRLLMESIDQKLIERPIFIKRVYRGATLEDAADDVGRPSATGTRWARRRSKGDFSLPMPNFGGGRPPKLGEKQQQHLSELLRKDQPWKKQEMQHLVKQELDVEFHPVYLSISLEKLGLSYTISWAKHPSWPENAEEILDERVVDAFDEGSGEPHNRHDGDNGGGWVVDEEIRTDGGTVLGFLDTPHPRPWDNSQRLYTVDDPHITRPLVKLDEPTAGPYAVSGESILQPPSTQEKERIRECLEGVREQNPGGRILLVSDNFSSHVCEYTRKRIHQPGTDLVLLPVGSLDLNPIEQVWKNLKQGASPPIVESTAEHRVLLTRLFEQLTTKLSFAASWIDSHLGNYLQKLRQILCPDPTHVGQLFVTCVRVYAQASSPTRDRSRVSAGWSTGFGSNRAGLEEFEMGSVAVDRGERGRIPRSPHQVL